MQEPGLLGFRPGPRKPVPGLRKVWSSPQTPPLFWSERAASGDYPSQGAAGLGPGEPSRRWETKSAASRRRGLGKGRRRGLISAPASILKRFLSAQEKVRERRVSRVLCSRVGGRKQVQSWAGRTNISPRAGYCCGRGQCLWGLIATLYP